MLSTSGSDFRFFITNGGWPTLPVLTLKGAPLKLRLGGGCLCPLPSYYPDPRSGSGPKEVGIGCSQRQTESHRER